MRITSLIFLAAAVSTTPSLAQTVDGRVCPLVDYCTHEPNMGSGNCDSGKFWEVVDTCGSGKKVTAVSCSINNFNNSPRLIENRIDDAGTRGICVYEFDGGVPQPLPDAKITLLCSSSRTDPTPPCPK